MEINGENINIEDIIKTQKPDFLKTRKNNIILRDSHIETLKRNGINYEEYSNLKSLILKIEEILLEEENEELELLSEELSEINYYNYTNK